MPAGENQCSNRVPEWLAAGIAALLLATGAATLLALSNPATARFYTFWRCGEVVIHMVDNQERKAMRALPGKHPDTWTITFEGLKHTTFDQRGLNFKWTDKGPSLNGHLCKTMPDEEWEKLHPGEFGRQPL